MLLDSVATLAPGLEAEKPSGQLRDVLIGPAVVSITQHVTPGLRLGLGVYRRRLSNIALDSTRMISGQGLGAHAEIFPRHSGPPESPLLYLYEWYLVAQMRDRLRRRR